MDDERDHDDVQTDAGLRAPAVAAFDVAGPAAAESITDLSSHGTQGDGAAGGHSRLAAAVEFVEEVAVAVAAAAQIGSVRREVS